MRKAMWILATLAVGVGVATSGSAQSTGAADTRQIVQEIQDGEWPFEDTTYRWNASLIENGTETRTFAMDVWTKGSEKLLVRFTAPGEIAGLAILQLGPGTMYMFNPEDHAVRLVAGSARLQGIVGTDYAPADAGLNGLVRDYDARVLETTEALYRVEFVPHSDEISPYSKLVVEFDRAHHKAVKIECYLDGVLAKTIVRDQFERHGDAEHFARMRVINNQVDRVTDMRLVEWSVNTGLDDRRFTKRSLMMGD